MHRHDFSGPLCRRGPLGWGELDRLGAGDRTGLEEPCSSKPSGPLARGAKSYDDGGVSKATCVLLRVGAGGVVR